MIDFANLSEAVDMVNYFHHVPDHSSLKNIEAAHSSYQQLTIDTNRIQSTMNTIQQAKQIKEAAQTGGEGCVIKVMISNLVYPVCIDALYQVFSKYGNVLKIVLIQKSNLLLMIEFFIKSNLLNFFKDDVGALIQMKDEIQAQTAINVNI